MPCLPPPLPISKSSYLRLPELISSYLGIVYGYHSIYSAIITQAIAAVFFFFFFCTAGLHETFFKGSNLYLLGYLERF